VNVDHPATVRRQMFAHNALEDDLAGRAHATQVGLDFYPGRSGQSPA
jgi:hypothetical protein